MSSAKRRQDSMSTLELLRNLITSTPPAGSEAGTIRVQVFMRTRPQTPTECESSIRGGRGEKGVQGWAGLRPLALRAINQNKLKSGSLSTYGAFSNKTSVNQDQAAPANHSCTTIVCKLSPTVLVISPTGILSNQMQNQRNV